MLAPDLVDRLPIKYPWNLPFLKQPFVVLQDDSEQGHAILFILNHCKLENCTMEVHYINTGFPYTVTESFMDLFEGLTYAQADAALSGVLHDQGSPYWPIMHTNSYKYGVSGSGSNSSYTLSHAYDVTDHALRFDGGGRVWDSPALLNNEELSPLVLPDNGSSAESGVDTSTEECIRTHHNATSPQQVIWQDSIDPDNMTYEELLDLGEAVGTQSRGLPRELILSLPVSKYKCSFFSRKKGHSERCVICQMNYKRGDRQMTLPCKHVYHVGCISKWLGINKACPVCFAEVFGEKPRRT